MKDKMISKLAEKKIPERIAGGLAEDLLNVDERLAPLRDAWLEGDESKDIAVNGYSVSRFVEYGMAYHAALLSMDWLIKEPQAAKEALGKGID